MTKTTNDALVLPVWPDTARKLGLGRNAIYEAIARGEIPVLRFGRRIVVPKAALDRLLNGDGPGPVKRTA